MNSAGPREGVTRPHATDAPRADARVGIDVDLGSRPPDAVSPEGLVALAEMYTRANRVADAEALYRTVLEPLAPVLVGFGRHLASQRRFAEGMALLAATTALMPDSSTAPIALGNVLLQAGRASEAEALARHLLCRAADDPGALALSGAALLALERPLDALAPLERATTIEPRHAWAWINLGVALTKLGRFADAQDALGHALAVDPESVFTLSNLAKAYADQGDSLTALAIIRDARRLQPDAPFAAANELFFLNDAPNVDPAEVFDAHGAWGSSLAAHHALARIAHTNTRDPKRRLRIGYVSPDLWSHPVAYFLAPLLACHDRESFETICYSNRASGDAMTARLRGLVDGWREIANHSDREVVAAIRADSIDVLIDLAGHSAGNRLGVFACAPAPVQMSWLGYANTTGLPTIQYRVTDAFADPPGTTEHLHTETLVRPHASFLCYGGLDDAPPPDRTPGGPLTFGSFNQLRKLSEATLDLWAGALRAVPEARLRLKALGLNEPATAAIVLERLGSRGVAPERVVLAPPVQSLNAHLASYGEVDIALDAFPYHGTTTTCEALWMGVPVVTFAGREHRSRVGVSLLSNVGLPDLVADSPAAFTRIAVGLAGDAARRAELRAGMREQMRRSRLMDAPAFARAFEGALRDAWKRWCEESDGDACTDRHRARHG